MIEKRHRIEDALEAVRAAKEDGIVTGGGTALLRAVQNLEVDTDNAEQAQGVAIIKEACYEPIRQILTNAGKSPDVVINNILQSDQSDIGLDVATDQYVDLYEAGVVDPVKVTCCAIKNAMSIPFLIALRMPIRRSNPITVNTIRIMNNGPALMTGSRITLRNPKSIFFSFFV